MNTSHALLLLFWVVGGMLVMLSLNESERAPTTVGDFIFGAVAGLIVLVVLMLCFVHAWVVSKMEIVVIPARTSRTFKDGN